MSEVVPRKEEPPFPWMGMSFLCLGMLAHSIVFTSPLPYVAFMVVDFKMTDNLDEAGYTAGWITGMFMMGRTIAGVPWGMAADRYGRKMCLFISMVNVAVLGTLFGFSTSFTMAVFLRFMIGLGNGFMGVCKTVVTEMVLCKEHEVRAFGFINGVWGLGLIVGPAIGGLLSRPAIQYPGIFTEDGLWGRYPYLLPSLTCAFFAALAAVGVFLFVPETLKTRVSIAPSSSAAATQRYEKLADQSTHSGSGKSLTSEDTDTEEEEAFRKDQQEFLGSFGWNQRRLDLTISKSALLVAMSPSSSSPSSSPVTDDEESKDSPVDEETGLELTQLPVPHERSPMHTTAALTDDDNGDNFFPKGDSPELMEAGADVSSSTSDMENTATTKPKLPATMMEILQSTQIQFLFVVYMSYCFLIMYIDETFPLWCVTSVSNGGLGWESAEVGETLASIGLGLVVFQLFAYEWMINKFFNTGAVRTYFHLLLCSATFMIILPLLSDATLRGLRATEGSHLHTKSNAILRLAIVGCWLCYRIPATAAFSTLAMVVNGSVDQSMRGTMNGLIMTAGSVGNGLGPIIGSTVYAFALSMAYHSDTHHSQPKILPIDGRIVFITGGLMAIALAYTVRAKMVVDD